MNRDSHLASLPADRAAQNDDVGETQYAGCMAILGVLDCGSTCFGFLLQPLQRRLHVRYVHRLPIVPRDAGR